MPTTCSVIITVRISNINYVKTYYNKYKYFYQLYDDGGLKVFTSLVIAVVVTGGVVVPKRRISPSKPLEKRTRGTQFRKSSPPPLKP